MTPRWGQAVGSPPPGLTWPQAGLSMAREGPSGAQRQPEVKDGCWGPFQDICMRIYGYRLCGRSLVSRMYLHTPMGRWPYPAHLHYQDLTLTPSHTPMVSHTCIHTPLLTPHIHTHLYSFPSSAVTEYHTLDDCKQQNLVIVSRFWRLDIQNHGSG